MTPTYLTGYVQSTIDTYHRCNGYDKRKELSFIVTESLPFEFSIEFAYVAEIKEANYVVHDAHDRGMIAVHDPKPIVATEVIKWWPTEGTLKLQELVEQMIERINKIEL